MSEARASEANSGTNAKAHVSAWPMWVIGFAIMIDNLDQYIVRGMAPQLRSAFHVGDFAIGVLFSAFIIVNGIVTVPAGYMGDRWNRTKAMAVTIVLWSVVSALGGAVPATLFALLVAVRGLLGFGQAITEPSGSSLQADYYALERRGRAFSVMQCLIYVGLGLGLALGTAVGPIDHGKGWRLAFLISLFPGLLAAILVWRLPEPRRGSADRAHVAGGDAFEMPAEAKEPLFPEGLWRFIVNMGDGLKADYKTILSIPTMRLSLVGVSAILFTVTAMATWTPEFYQRQLHLGQRPANLAFGALVVVAGIPGTVIGGRLADRWVNRIPGARMTIPGVCLAICSTLLIISFLRLPFSAAYPIQLVAFFVATSSVPALRAGLSDTVPAHLRGTGFGAFNLTSVIFGSAAAPIVTSFIATQLGNNFRTAFLIEMPLTFVGALFLLRARKHIEADTAKIFEAVVLAMAAEQAKAAAAPTLNGSGFQSTAEPDPLGARE